MIFKRTGQAPQTLSINLGPKMDQYGFSVLKRGGRGLVQILNPKPPPPLPAEYYLSINFWPIFSKIKQISVYEYYFFEIPSPPLPPY